MWRMAPCTQVRAQLAAALQLPEAQLQVSSNVADGRGFGGVAGLAQGTASLPQGGPMPALGLSRGAGTDQRVF